MMHAVLLAVQCREGRLVITPEAVYLARRHSLRRRPKWEAERTEVAGASITREPRAVRLTICACDGTPRHVHPLRPSDTLRVVELLGYADATAILPSIADTRQIARMPCAGGHIELTSQQLTFRPRLPWRSSHAWTLARAEVSGVSTIMRPGTRMLHDLVIHTTGGGIFVLRRLRPEHALALSRLLGHLYAALPAEPKSQREALEYHVVAKPRARPIPDEIAIAPPRPRTKRRNVQRELDHLWRRQRGAGGHYRPLPGA